MGNVLFAVPTAWRGLGLRAAPPVPQMAPSAAQLLLVEVEGSASSVPVTVCFLGTLTVAALNK